MQVVLELVKKLEQRAREYIDGKGRVVNVAGLAVPVAEELTELLSAYRGTHVLHLDENKQKENERNREAIAEAMYYFNARLLLGLQHTTPPEKPREGFKPPKI